MRKKKLPLKEKIHASNVLSLKVIFVASFKIAGICIFWVNWIILFEESIPKESKSYIENRIKEIELQKNGNKYTPEYIPTDEITKQPDFKNIFLTRDELGKIDGYRFYEDYFSRNDDNEVERLDDLCNRYPNEEWRFLFKPEVQRINGRWRG